MNLINYSNFRLISLGGDYFRYTIHGHFCLNYLDFNSFLYNLLTFHLPYILLCLYNGIIPVSSIILVRISKYGNLLMSSYFDNQPSLRMDQLKSPHLFIKIYFSHHFSFMNQESVLILIINLKRFKLNFPISIFIYPQHNPDTVVLFT